MTRTAASSSRSVAAGAGPMPVTAFRGATVVDLLRWRAEQHPDAPLFTFLGDDDADAVHLSFGDLDRRARAVAARLSAEARAGERALLLYASDREFVVAFFGCLYAGIVAVPAYPPEPTRIERTLPRLRGIVRDARPRLVLSTSDLLALGDAVASMAPELRDPEWIATDRIETAPAWRAPAVSGESLALLQYTSGSTADPRGVMVSHQNLLHDEEMIRRAFAHDPRTASGVGWLPVFHDMGLMGNVLQPVYAGFHTALLSPLAFLATPQRWLQAISDFQATTSGGPNFAYELCLRRISAEERARLDLRSWTVAFSGAEPVVADTLRRFADRFADCGFRPHAFYPCYGMAEATLMITGGATTEPPRTMEVDADALARHRVVSGAGERTRRLVSCGRPLLDERLLIVDPERRTPCPDGHVGEIWVAGGNVAQGYWGRPAASAHTFGARLADTGHGPFLRTGDLGFVRDGELYVTGRLKDMIIVRGRNHYAQDLERTAERCDPALRPGAGAAFPVEVDGEDRVVLVHEVRRDVAAADCARVAGEIRRAVTAEHRIQLYATILIESGTIPKTSSGKIRRRACRDQYLEGTLVVRHRWVHGASRRDAARAAEGA